MTSVILAHKLLTLNSCKTEFEKLKRLRENNLEQTHKAIPYLKGIIERQAKSKTCRLCLKPGNISIFNNQKGNYAATIENVLQIKIQENDQKPQYICSSCETILKNAEQLKQTAEVTQWRLQQEFEMVTNTPLDIDSKPVPQKRHHGRSIVKKKNNEIVRKWVCGKCQRTFKTQHEFDIHVSRPVCKRNRPTIRSFMCETCGAKFTNSTTLNNHKLIHTDKLDFPCSYCPYRGRTKYATQIHERAHTGARPYSCPHCPATFRSHSNLATHRAKHLPKAFACQLCEKRYINKTSLDDHIVIQHSTAKPHICNICENTFATRKQLNRHEIKVHNRPKQRPGRAMYLKLGEQQQSAEVTEESR